MGDVRDNSAPTRQRFARSLAARGCSRSRRVVALRPTRHAIPPSVAAMLACVATFALEGVVEPARSPSRSTSARGLPTFTLVGLPDRAVRESRERVRAALLNSGLDFPQKRLTVNLAPAHVRKAGPSFDLAIARRPAGRDRPGAAARRSARYALCGELSLSGEIEPVRGALAAALGRPAGRLPATCSCRSANAARGRAGRGGRGARHPHPGAARGPAARQLGPRAARLPQPRPDRRRAQPRRSTWPTSAARRTPSGRSRSPRPAATTC